MKIKEKAVHALSLKFRLSSYFVSGKYGEDESDESPGINGAIDALIDTGYRISEFKRRAKDFDMHNCLLVPAWKDENGVTPIDSRTLQIGLISSTTSGTSPRNKSRPGVMIVSVRQRTRWRPTNVKTRSGSASY